MGAVGRVSGLRWVQRFVGYNVKFSLLVNRIFGPGKIDGRPCRVTRVQVCGCVLGVQSPRCGADNETVCVELIRRKPGRVDVVVNAR